MYWKALALRQRDQLGELVSAIPQIDEEEVRLVRDGAEPERDRPAEEPQNDADALPVDELRGPGKRLVVYLTKSSTTSKGPSRSAGFAADSAPSSERPRALVRGRVACDNAGLAEHSQMDPNWPRPLVPHAAPARPCEARAAHA